MSDLNETSEFRPRFDAGGLLTAVVTDEHDRVLMVAHMNREALDATVRSGRATFWSRSRKQLWTKGETSGNTLLVREVRIDCDQDCLLLKVEPQGDGVACHTGRRSCFYRRVENGRLVFDG